MGLRASYVGAFGRQDPALDLRAELVRRNVAVDFCVTRDVPNGYAVILIDDRRGERVVLWQRDSRLALQPDEIPPAAIVHARLLHVDDVDEEAALKAASIARDAGMPVTSDIERVSDRTPDLVAAVTVPIFAEHVPSRLTGRDDIEESLRLLRRPHHMMLCATLGARGAVLLEGDRIHRVAGCPVNAIDTTGAGDVFRGAFIYAYLRGDSPGDILRFANTAAAASCTRLGAIT
jgi:sugar/nucleoside kinase (ribokinase family)